MLSFAQPLFLLAMGGLVLPFLIHRISRARPVAWNFPSITRIRKTPLPRQGKRAISDWLLLLLRTLLLALLILALAGPQWTPRQEAASTSGQTEASGVILVDVSSSMAGWAAPGQVQDILESLDAEPGVRWSWIVADSAILAELPPQQTPAGASAIATLRTFIRETAPSRTGLDPRKALQRAREFLEQGEGPRELHVISDFQESNWSGSLPELPEDVSVQLHRVGTVDRDRNLAIRDVIVVPTDRERLRVIGRIMNFGIDSANTNVRLQTADGSSRQPALLEPGVLTTVAFEIPRPTGTPEAALELMPVEADPYPRDDRLEFRASAPPALEVLALDLSSGPGGGSEETFFLEQALDTGSGTEWIRYSLLNVGRFAINPETLARTTAVFIPATTFGDPSVPWDVLKGFVEAGGLVIATMGEDAVRGIQGLRSAGYPVGDYAGLAGRGRAERFYVGEIPTNSRLADVFQGPAGRDLHLMSIRQYARLRLPDEAVLLLQSEGGDPLLARLPFGKGNLVLSAFPWDRTASDFPLRPSFLPVVREVFALGNPDPGSLPGMDTEAPVPTAESVTTTSPSEEILTRLRGGRSDSPGSSSFTAELAGRSEAGVKLGPWLLLAALLVFVTESLLARRLITRP
jgi:hypothetical protein